MTFKALDSLAEQIAHYLAERIIRGELKERERIQEQKVTQALNVSRGSVREALLILERRHLIVILPRRGAQVSELTPHHVASLYALSIELYIMLARAVIERWKVETDLAPFIDIQQRLLASLDNRAALAAFCPDATVAVTVLGFQHISNRPSLRSCHDSIDRIHRHNPHRRRSRAAAERVYLDYQA